MNSESVNEDQTTSGTCGFDGDVVANKLLVFFSESYPYRRLNEFNRILEGLKDLPRSEVIRLFASITQYPSFSDVSAEKLFKLSGAWLFCTNTSQINKYPNLTNRKLLAWCYTGLFSNVNIALGYLSCLLKGKFKGANPINLYYKYLYNEFAPLEELIDMVPKNRNGGACDGIFCCLISLYENIFKRYNQFFYNSPLDESLLSDLHHHLKARIKESNCKCWNKLILPMIQIYLSSGEQLENCLPKFDMKPGEFSYFDQITIPPTDQAQNGFTLSDVKHFMKFSKEWRLLIGEGEPVKGPINDTALARKTLFTLVNHDIFDKDKLVAYAIWALILISGNTIIKVTAKKIVVQLLDIHIPTSELSMDIELYNTLLTLLHHVDKNLEKLAVSALTISFLAILIHALSNYWAIIEKIDQNVVGKVLLYFIPSIDSKGEYIYSKHQSILLYIEILVKSALRIALPEHILQCSNCFILVRPTDLSVNEPKAQEMYHSIAYYLFICSIGIFYRENPSLKPFTSYLVRWSALLSRFNDFSLYQIRLMTAIICNILPVIMRKSIKSPDSLISFINVVFTAFISNPVLDSMWNKRGRRAEHSMLLDEVARLLKITFVLYNSTLLQHKLKLSADLLRCTSCTISRFVEGLLKLLPTERRQLPIFIKLKEILKEGEEIENAIKTQSNNVQSTSQEVLVTSLGEKRRKYNYKLNPNDDFIDFETDKHLGMLIMRDESVRLTLM